MSAGVRGPARSASLARGGAVLLAVGAAVAAQDAPAGAGFGAVAADTEMTGVTVTAVVGQADGKVVVLWTGDTSFPGCARQSTGIARFTADGTPDPGFGDTLTPGRTQLLGFCGESLLLRSLLVDGSGRLVLAGSRSYAPGRHAVAIRLLPNGAIDTGFADAGLATLDRADAVFADDEAVAVLPRVAPAAGLVLVGSVRDRTPATSRDAFLWVLEDDGTALPQGNHADADGLAYRREGFARAGFVCDTAVSSAAARGDDAVVLAAADVLCSDGEQSFGYPAVLRLPLVGLLAAKRRSFTFDPASPLDAATLEPGPILSDRLQLVRAPDDRYWLSGVEIGGAPVAARPMLAVVDAELDFVTGLLGGTGRAPLPVVPAFVPAFPAVRGDGQVVIAGLAAATEGLRLAAIAVEPTSGALAAGFGPSPGQPATALFAAGPAAEAARVALAPDDGAVLLAGALEGALRRLPGVARLGDDGGADAETLFEDGFE